MSNPLSLQIWCFSPSSGTAFTTIFFIFAPICLSKTVFTRAKCIIWIWIWNAHFELKFERRYIFYRVYAKLHRDASFEMRISNDSLEVFSSYASRKLRSEIIVWMPWPLNRDLGVELSDLLTTSAYIDQFGFMNIISLHPPYLGGFQEHNKRWVFQTMYCFSSGTGVRLGHCIIFCLLLEAPQVWRTPCTWNRIGSLPRAACVQKHRKCELRACMIGRVPGHSSPAGMQNPQIWSLVCTLRNSNIAITSLVCTLRNSKCTIQMIIPNYALSSHVKTVLEGFLYHRKSCL